MPKRPVRGSGKSRACSGDLGDSAPPPKKTNILDGTLWVDDDTLKSPTILVLEKGDSDHEDSEYFPSEEESTEGEFQILIRKRAPKPNEQVNLFTQTKNKFLNYF